MAKHTDHERDTQLVSLGRDTTRDGGSVNPPIHRTSTIFFPDYATFRDHEIGKLQGFASYGRHGTPTTAALEEALIALEGADHAILTASGLAAITTSLLAFLNAGDHVLIPDSMYGCGRHFADHELTRLGVEVTHYDPTIGAGIAPLMRSNTKVVFCESPGSQTFEMQDIPAIAAVTHTAGAIVMADNTWATPLLQNAFALGIDISIHSITKYISGHSDLVMGAVLCKSKHFAALNRAHRNIGSGTNSDNAYLALRGLRTLSVRLKQHEASALAVAQWLQTVPEVKRVLFPALPTDPGHAIWKRDMTGSNGLLAAELTQATDAALSAMLDGLQHFGMGYSWGGYESLVTAYRPAAMRTATRWNADTTLLRLHIGLEATSDLIADLDAGFARFRAALK